MLRIAVINQKGGCGKTTTAINLAATLAESGKRVLLVDLDPQSHCSLGLSVPESAITDVLAQALLRGIRPGPELTEGLWQVSTNLYLAPSNRQLWQILPTIGQKPDGHRRLTQSLDRIIEDFEICIIDTPPSLGLLTQNGLRAAERVIVPVDSGYFSMRQALTVPTTLRAMAAGLSHRVEVYLLPTMQSPNMQTNQPKLQDIADKARAIVLSPIRQCESIQEAQRRGQPIHEMDPANFGTVDYQRLAREALSALPSIQEAPEQPPLPDDEVTETFDQPTAKARRGHHLTDTPKLQISEPEAPKMNQVPGAGASERVLELVRRARSLAEKNAKLRESREEEERLAKPNSKNRLKASQYGVRVTRQGALFVQPDEGAEAVLVSGDFNNWSDHENPMNRNEQLGVWEICIPLEPGRYRYNLIIDGRPMPDPHNESLEEDDRGRRTNYLVIN